MVIMWSCIYIFNAGHEEVLVPTKYNDSARNEVYVLVNKYEFGKERKHFLGHMIY